MSWSRKRYAESAIAFAKAAAKRSESSRPVPPSLSSVAIVEPADAVAATVALLTKPPNSSTHAELQQFSRALPYSVFRVNTAPLLTADFPPTAIISLINITFMLFFALLVHCTPLFFAARMAMLCHLVLSLLLLL